MENKEFEQVFTQDVMKKMFPSDRADDFFDALLGDSSDGAYDISLEYKNCRENELAFEFHLKERPGKCLSCSLTYGLPTVFSRHPIIDIEGVVKNIDSLLNGSNRAAHWNIGTTHEKNRQLHVIPLTVVLESS